MVASLLIMIAGGIGLSQSISHSRQVTLGWLRLGGLISISMMSVAALLWWRTDRDFLDTPALLGAGTIIMSAAQLTAAQLGKPAWSRVAGGLVYALSVVCVWSATAAGAGNVPLDSGVPEQFGLIGLHPIAWAVAIALGSALQGGFLMTMLLGHAYLAADGQMTQRPLFRLTVALAVLLLLRTIVSGTTGLWPYYFAPHSPGGPYGFGAATWEMMMIVGRYAVGLVVPGVFVYMIYDCVRRRANQSATGILYVATVLIILGEGMALSLAGTTGFAF